MRLKNRYFLLEIVFADGLVDESLHGGILLSVMRQVALIYASRWPVYPSLCRWCKIRLACTAPRVCSSHSTVYTSACLGE
jgi:hypothetical protein